MKKILFLFSLTIMAACSNAQTPKGGKTYLDSIKHIPAYRILTTDSVFITPANLQKSKPVMLVFFAPDCSHCQKMMYELKPKLATLKNIQVIMIANTLRYDLRALREFKRDFGLKDYPNITIGTEGDSYFVVNYYAIRTTPFIAMYDSKGNIEKYYDKVVPPETILASAKKLR